MLSFCFMNKRQTILTIILITILAFFAGRASASPQEDLDALALTLYHEGRGESDRGLVAIGEVIVNRSKHRYWKPTTIKGIIYQPYQFSYLKLVKDTTMVNFKQKKRAYRIASSIIDGTYMPVVGKYAYYYYNPKLASPNWKHYRHIANIGDHIYLGIK